MGKDLCRDCVEFAATFTGRLKDGVWSKTCPKTGREVTENAPACGDFSTLYAGALKNLGAAKD